MKQLSISLQHLTGIVATLALVMFLGRYSGKKVITSRDFSVANQKAGSILVAGTIMGTLVGGSSTVGTAQLAFMYGFSAWWFTLGGGIACFLLGVIFVAPARGRNFETVPRFVKEEYGEKAALLAVIFVSLGIFVNIIPQIMSFSALILSMFTLSAWTASLLAGLLMVIYVLFGGVWATSLIGTTKIVLTILSLMVAGVLALSMLGGIGGLMAAFPSYPWFSLFGRGVNQDLAAAFSLIVGVLSSQIYFQAVFSAKDLKSARNGALISAVTAPLIGLAGIVVGLFMRVNHPDIIPAQALPVFVLRYLNPWFGGVVQTTLLLAAIGTGAGLVLGVSTMLCRDIYQKFCPNADDGQVLLFFRFFIVALIGLALAVVYFTGGDGIILQWGYLSLGLRGSSIFFPLIAILFLKGKVAPAAGTAAVFAGPACVLLGGLLPWELNSLYLGLLASLAIILVGFLWNSTSALKRG
jgi:solute:Na+ symporter, SSS family